MKAAPSANKNAMLTLCMVLLLTIPALGTNPAHLASGVANKADGNAGDAPGVQAYLGIGSSTLYGFDAHGVYGIATRDGGFLTVGTGLQKEDAAREASWPWSNYMNGYAWKAGLCASYRSKDTMLPDTPDPKGCGLQWVHEASTATQQAAHKNAKLLWVAESPTDGSFIVAGMLWTSDGYDRYILKLSPDGAKVWDRTYPDSQAGKAGALESVTFTQDGGFVVSGFTNSDERDPVFKSSGQAGSGRPVLMKFTKDDASSSSPPGEPSWVYTAPSTDDYTGSAKVVREADDGTIMALAGQQTALIKLSAKGSLIWANVFDEPNQGTDFVPVPNGTVVTGLRQYSSTAVCPDGCGYNTGELVHIAQDGQSTAWKYTYGNPPGGLNQFKGLAAGPPELIYTECWGIQATRDMHGNVNGVVTACGTGIEGCDTPGLTDALVAECRKDPRTTWRSLTVGFNLQGEVLWRRVDNFKNKDTGSIVGTSANEYVFLRADGSPVGVTDEGFGVGLLVMSFNSTTTTAHG